VILGIEGKTDTPFDVTISLTEPYGLLQDDKFNAVSDEISPKVAATNSRIS
jgi:hypothetical protein